jgi:type I restriction enzyme S subunit
MTTSTVPLGEVCHLIRGVTFEGSVASTRPAPGTVPILRAGNIQDELDTDHDLVWVPEPLVTREQLLRRNDIVICMSSGSRDVVGKTARVPADLHASFGSFCGVIRPREPNWAAYLSFYFRSAAFARHRDAIARGANIQNLRFSQFTDIQVPVPDGHEAIAARLERANRLRRTRQYSLDMIQSVAAATFVHWFGDGNETFRVSTVDELAEDRPNAIRTGPFGSQLLHSEFKMQGIAVLGIDNVVNNRFEWGKRRFISPQKYEKLNRYTVFPGDVLITIMATCGRCAVVPEAIQAAINTKHLCCISLDRDRCLPAFLHAAFLFHPFVRQQLQVATKGAIMDGLNMGIIKSLAIPLPPLPIQERYVAFVEASEGLSATHMQAFQQADHLFQTLLDDAFGISN